MPDQLTGSLTREEFTVLVESDLRPGVALLCADVDQFALGNYHHGHSVGDVFLKRLFATIQDAAGDRLVGRFGGGEFVVYTREGYLAEALAERIRAAVFDATVELRTTPELGDSFTVSIGIADYDETRCSVRALVKDAHDAALEKHLGRNAVRRAPRRRPEA